MATIPDSVAEQYVNGLGEPLRGKVRDSYDLGDAYLPLATGRLSGYDFITGRSWPWKGEVLNAMNVFWRTGPLKEVIGDKHDLLLYGADIDKRLPERLRKRPDLQKRAIVIKKKTPMTREMIVRGYLTGSGLKPYFKDRTVCGHVLPEGLKDGSELPEPIFTPTTKAKVGHDEHVTAESVRREFGDGPEKLALEIYKAGRAYAKERGITIADTKFEFGCDAGELTLIDEVLTPDSSRFWPEKARVAALEKGKTPPSLDKEFARSYLKRFNVDLLEPKNPDHVERVARLQFPEDIVRTTGLLYRFAFWSLAGMKLERFNREWMGIDVPDLRPTIDIVVGSGSDLDQLEAALAWLKGRARYRVSVMSCHRHDDSDDTIDQFVRHELVSSELVLAGAGEAAALPGIIKAKMCKYGRFYRPVIGLAFKGKDTEADMAAKLSIKRLPGQPVELDANGEAYFGAEGALAAVTAAVEHEFYPKAMEKKPWSIGSYTE